MEHLYKAIAAYLNAKSDLADEEFLIKTNRELITKHPNMIEIFESEKYNYPNIIWPNGNYNFSKKIIYFNLMK